MIHKQWQHISLFGLDRLSVFNVKPFPTFFQNIFQPFSGLCAGMIQPLRPWDALLRETVWHQCTHHLTLSQPYTHSLEGDSVASMHTASHPQPAIYPLSWGRQCGINAHSISPSASHIPTLLRKSVASMHTASHPQPAIYPLSWGRQCGINAHSISPSASHIPTLLRKSVASMHTASHPQPAIYPLSWGRQCGINAHSISPSASHIPTLLWETVWHQCTQHLTLSQPYTHSPEGDSVASMHTPSHPQPAIYPLSWGRQCGTVWHQPSMHTASHPQLAIYPLCWGRPCGINAHTFSFSASHIPTLLRETV